MDQQSRRKAATILLQDASGNKGLGIARDKHFDMSPQLLPVDRKAHLVPDMFVHVLHHLVEKLDLDAYGRNDEVGPNAHDPSMMLCATELNPVLAIPHPAQSLVRWRAR